MITTHNMAKLLDWLHGHDLETLKEIEKVVGEAIRAKSGTLPHTDPSAPVVPLTPDSPMPFGKYKGQRLGSLDLDYLQWLWSKRPLRGPGAPELEAYLISLKLDLTPTRNEGDDDDE